MGEDVPISKPEVVGREGLGTTVAAVAAQISAVEKQGIQQNEALRRELLLEVRQVGTIISEWREAHEAVHVQQQRALEAATAALVDKLADMNEFRQQSRDRETLFANRESVEKEFDGVHRTMQAEKEDTRHRFEQMEA